MQSNMAQKGQLDAQQLIIFESEMKWRTKSGPLAFVLWAVLGLLGAHHFYLGRWLAAIGQLLLTVIVVVLYTMAAPALLLTGVAGLLGQTGSAARVQTAGTLLVFASLAATAMWLWWFISVFFIPRSIRRQAYEAERTLLAEMTKPSAQSAPANQAAVSAAPADVAPVTAAPVVPAPVAVTTETQPTDETAAPAEAVAIAARPAETVATAEPPAPPEEAPALPEVPSPSAENSLEQVSKTPPEQT